MSVKATETGDPILETPGTPTPEFISGKVADPSPGDSDAQLDALVERLMPRLEKVVTGVAQSDKDKGIASAKANASSALDIATDAKATVERFQAYVDAYGSEAAAFREMARDDKLSQIEAGKPATQTPNSAGADERPWGVRQKEILESAGLDPKDTRAVEFAKSKKWDDPEVYLKELSASTFAWAQDVTTIKPDLSTGAGPVGNSPAKSTIEGSDDELGAKIISLGRDYSKNQKQIAEITAELHRRNPRR